MHQYRHIHVLQLFITRSCNSSLPIRIVECWTIICASPGSTSNINKKTISEIVKVPLFCSVQCMFSCKCMKKKLKLNKVIWICMLYCLVGAFPPITSYGTCKIMCNYCPLRITVRNKYNINLQLHANKLWKTST